MIDFQTSAKKGSDPIRNKQPYLHIGYTPVFQRSTHVQVSVDKVNNTTESTTKINPYPEHTNLSTSRLFIVASQVLFSLRINMGNRLSHLIAAFIGSRMCSTNSQTNDLVTEFLDMVFNTTESTTAL